MDHYFAIRVELHGELHDGEKYKRLHHALESLGFSRFVTSTDGVRYQLPPAEYVYTIPGATEQTVADAAKRTADSINPSTVMVHTAIRWTGRGLKPAA
ncbi:MAG TPA: hypothetical protein VMS32_02240 [Verrucomicrobiae bacterium]|jgi:hypothetical protein|nr:hypothetical protein [Verrucomicrobiae bacterium]